MIEYIVSRDEEGIRADKIIIGGFRSISYTFLQKLFRKKKVKVNEKVANASDRLKNGDVIKIFANEISPSDKQYNQLEKCEKFSKQFERMIIFENKDFLAINKPTNLPVQKGTDVTVCVETLMTAFNSELKLVHRIDKNTSGILLIAKNSLSARKLTKLFREKKIHKTYYAIVDGKIKTSGTIRNFLQKTIVGNEEKIQITQNNAGQYAITTYIPHEINVPEFKYYTLLELYPETGRKHQLRVHCAEALHAPILGDRKYNKHSIHKQLFLHAYKVKIDELNIEITAELPKYFPSLILTS
ncbi:MAG: RluA family pseudouridine synthase [Alphaproteobacteria bacterium]|nr:RluA family pseudouridine synthase [Alphaproteobacteria bacterium]